MLYMRAFASCFDAYFIECFYNREGLWYYAGSYQGFRLEDLTVKEWAQLPTEVCLPLSLNCVIVRLFL